MKMVNNRVCVLHLSSRAVLNYFANWLCKVHEELSAHQRNAAGAPAHDQSHSHKVWRQMPGTAEEGNERLSDDL